MDKKILIICLLLFAVLVTKNPFSTFNNISDLEPTPDALHYLNPIKTFLTGQGLKLSYEGRNMPTYVPPLYSLSLIPMYLIFQDPRSFYFMNIFYSIISISIFYLIIKKLKLNLFIFAFSIIVVVTNFTIYWYPQAPMAENLLISLFLISIYLLMLQVDKRNVVFVAIVAMLMFATKYIAIFLSISLLAIYALKVYKTESDIKNKKRFLLIFIISFFAIILVMQIFDSINGKAPFLFMFFEKITGFLIDNLAFKSNLEPLDENYSFKYFNSNFIQYFGGLIGGDIKMAGLYPVLIPWIIGMFTIPAFILNFFDKKRFLFYLYLLTSSLITFLFICIYEITDARYIFPLVFASILSVICFFNNLYILFKKHQKKYLSYLILIIIFCGLFLSKFDELKKQIKSNYFEPNPPLNYRTVQSFNNFFSEKSSNRPVIITTLTPYFVDFYSNRNFKLLPLSNSQYFMDRAKLVWGDDDYTNLINLYKKYLNDGFELYVSEYKTEWSYFYRLDYFNIKQNFNLEKVASGCENKCNLFKLLPKSPR